MSVHRLAKYQTDDPFTRIPNTAIVSGLSLKGLGLLVFMLSKPDGWNFTERGLLSQLNIGRHALASAMDELIERGYVRRTSFMEGNLRRWVTEVYDVPCFGFPSIELPERAEIQALSNEGTKATKERSNTRQKKQTAMTEDWQPSPDNLEGIRTKHPTLNIPSQIERFRDHYISKGEKRANWNASLRTWMRNAEEWSKPKGQAPSGKFPAGSGGVYL